jgi:hypothetical protein
MEKNLMSIQIDRSVLEMALVGYEAERRKIEEKIEEIQRQLGGRIKGTTPAASTDGARAKRGISVAGRRRIAEAQKQRWATFRIKQGARTVTRRKVAKKRRTLSPAAKAKLAANLTKARAAKAAKAAAGAS